ALLGRVAAAGGGRVLTEALDAVAPPARASVARWLAWPTLLLIAVLLWPVEIAARRLALPHPEGTRPRWLPGAIRVPGSQRAPEPAAPVELRAIPGIPGPTPDAAAVAPAA